MATLKSSLILSLIDRVSGPSRGIGGALDRLNRQHRALAGPMLGMTARLAAFGATYLGVTQGMQGTAGAAMSFESAFADVRKVVDANDEQFANLRRTIIGMSKELPLAANDIAALFAAAGESGVATTDLKAFAEMAARVGIAFDMGAGEAGESLAKLKTQLGLSVAETGDMADAINHLSNNMASKASAITDYMLRVGALAEMGGFASEEIAAIGSAMIAAGAQSETAGTAMQNVVKALTRGGSAKKAQRDAARALGLDLPQIAKDMQKDAPKALKHVLKAIAKAPKERHISLLSEFFGDEAKAFAPLIGNIGLLDQALGSVARKTDYAGSAFDEYRKRAATTANQLEIVQNNFSALGIAIGDQMLPTINAGLSSILDVFETLGERATVFDRVGMAIQGFTHGLGPGFGDTFKQLNEFLLGPVDGSGAADQLGRIFAQFKGWGADVRAFNEAVANNPITGFLGDVAGYGFKLFLAAGAIGMLAGTIRKLAGALMLLSGASAALSILKTLSGLKGLPGTVPVPGGKPGNNPTGGKGGLLATLLAGSKHAGKFLLRNPWLTAGAITYGALDAIPHEAAASAERNNPNRAVERDNYQRQFGGVHFEGGMHRAGSGAGPQPNGGQKPVVIDGASIAAMTQPNGVQQVLVTNQERPQVNVNVTMNNSFGQASPPSISQLGRLLGDEIKSAVGASWSGPY